MRLSHGLSPMKFPYRVKAANSKIQAIEQRGVEAFLTEMAGAHARQQLDDSVLGMLQLLERATRYAPCHRTCI